MLHVSVSEADNGILLVLNINPVGDANVVVIDPDTMTVLHISASEADDGILLV